MTRTVASGETVAVGDRRTVTVSPDATVQVILADGGRQQAIDKWTGPDG